MTVDSVKHEYTQSRNIETYSFMSSCYLLNVINRMDTFSRNKTSPIKMQCTRLENQTTDVINCHWKNRSSSNIKHFEINSNSHEFKLNKITKFTSDDRVSWIRFSDLTYFSLSLTHTMWHLCWFTSVTLVSSIVYLCGGWSLRCAMCVHVYCLYLLMEVNLMSTRKRCVLVRQYLF